MASVSQPNLNTKSGVTGHLELKQAELPADFAALFAEYAPYVLGLVVRLGVREADAEDVAQEVFLVVHRKLPEFEGRSSLKTWICGIARNSALAHQRRAHVRRELAIPAGEAQADGLQYERLKSEEQAVRLCHALDQLSTKLRQVFVLYEIEELAMADVARIVGCAKFTGYTRLRAARAQVRKQLRRYEGGAK